MAILLPPGNQVVNVSMINPVNFGPAVLKRFMAPDVPELQTFKTSPSLSFLVEHPSGRKLVFDLGIRKDFQNYAPVIRNYLPTTDYNIQIEKDVATILTDNAVSPDQIEAVIWSHWHWDHIGDPSTFPDSTALVVGPGFKKAMTPGFPSNPDSPILESDYEGRDLREIDFTGPHSLRIGQFSAFDYFDDGSFYLLDSPGHAIGHLCGLARTTTNPSTFVLLGGDICHYPGIFRPSKHLHIPQSVTPHPWDQTREALCPGHVFEELQKSRGRTVRDSLFDMTFGLDIPLATKTKEKLEELDCLEDVFVIVAHDSTVRDGVVHFPKNLNRWKEQGWGNRLKWAFLRDLEPHWVAQEQHLQR